MKIQEEADIILTDGTNIVRFTAQQFLHEISAILCNRDEMRRAVAYSIMEQDVSKVSSYLGVY